MVRQSFAALEDRAHHRLCSGRAPRPRQAKPPWNPGCPTGQAPRSLSRVAMYQDLCKQALDWQADEKWGVQSRCVGIARSLRVSLRYNFFPFLTRKGARGIVEGVFQRPAS